MKWTNRIIISLVVALLTSLLVLLFSTIYYSSEKKMDLTNLISAIANAIMAVAAVYAAVNAKGWLDVKKKESSLPLIAKFHEEHILSISPATQIMLVGIGYASNESRLYHSKDALIKWRKELLNDKGILHKEKVREYINNSYTVYTSFYMREVAELYKSESKLHIYGWNIDNQSLYNELKTKKVEFFESACILLHDLDNYISITFEEDKVLKNKSKVGDDSMLFDVNVIEDLKEREKTLEKLNDEIIEIIKKLRFDVWK